MNETAELLNMALAETLEAEGFPSLTAVLVQGDEIPWQHTVGFANVASSRPANSHTLYRIGSVTKLFTGMAVMQLRDAGKLALDQPVAEVIPSLAHFDPQAVTFRRLLSHTSGLPTMPPLPDLLEKMAQFPPDPTAMREIRFPDFDELIASLDQVEPVQPPADQFTYSNVGASLLGYALQQLSGQTYPEYITQQILRPLGMSSAGFRTDGIRDYVTGYLPGEGAPVPAPPQVEDIRAFLPAGGLRASTAEMARFLLALNRAESAPARPLSRSSLVEMYLPVVETRSSRYTQHGPGGIGLAWHLASLNGLRVVEHGGADPSTAAFLAHLPERNLGVFVATNTGSNPMAVALLAYEILELWLDK